MHVSSTIRLIWTFYRNFFPAMIAVTLSCAVLSGLYDVGVSALFWFKVITSGVIGYRAHSIRHREYYYYHNLGLSKAILWTTSLLFDFGVFPLLIVLTARLT